MNYIINKYRLRKYFKIFVIKKNIIRQKIIENKKTKQVLNDINISLVLFFNQRWALIYNKGHIYPIICLFSMTLDSRINSILKHLNNEKLMSGWT